MQRILIVDDSAGVLRPLQRALSLLPDGGYLVETAESASAALAQINAAHFSLVISDLRLPDMDGLALLEQVIQTTPEVRAVLITAFGSPQVEQRARQLGIVYLPKPFRLHDLARIVRHLLSEPSVAPRALPTAASRAAAVSCDGAAPSTHLKVLASDLDGTLADNGVIPPATWMLLRQAKLAGFTLFLVTGRTLESFVDTGPYTETFDALVVEDGAVVYLPRRDVVRTPFGRLSSAITRRLETIGVPLERGMAIAATRVPYDMVIMDVLKEVNASVTVEYNRGAVMLLPPGATKGTGLMYALQELGYSLRNVVACGDAENDQSMFEAVELAAAVPHALPALKALADVVLPRVEGPWIAPLMTDLLAGRLPARRQRPERRLLLGYGTDNAPVNVDPLDVINCNVGIFGASGSGKSWLAGLLVEELLNKGYQVCLIDPEGDYRSLALSPRVLFLGGEQAPLAAVSDVINLSEWHSISLVVDLSSAEPEQQYAYTLELLRAMRGFRARRGRPHWLLLDEVQNFCPPEGNELSELLLAIMRESKGCGLVSYRPSLLPQALLDAIDPCLLTRLSLPEELEGLGSFLEQRGLLPAQHTQMPMLPSGYAYLCPGARAFGPAQGEALKFRAGPRLIPHIRHLNKYLRAPLPAAKRFYFTDPQGRHLGYTAANLWEFREILRQLPLASLENHLKRGDFERWLHDVLHDEELAHRIHKIGKHARRGEDLRQILLEAVVDRYEELDSLA